MLQTIKASLPRWAEFDRAERGTKAVKRDCYDMLICARLDGTHARIVKGEQPCQSVGQRSQ